MKEKSKDKIENEEGIIIITNKIVNKNEKNTYKSICYVQWIVLRIV